MKKITKRLILVLLVVLPVLCYLSVFIPKKESECRIIYYTIPEFNTSMSGSAVGGYLSKMFGDNNRIRVGHAGILVEDAKGNFVQYDYGRFPTCFGNAKLKSSKGNWVKKNLGNYKGKSTEELAKIFGPMILQRFNDSGSVVHFYAMEGDPEDVTKFIEKEANDMDRDRYVWYLDHTCCGRARSAFDHGRSWVGFCVSKTTDIFDNFVPTSASVLLSIDAKNVSAMSGLSVEGNAPLIGTTRYTYHLPSKHRKL